MSQCPYAVEALDSLIPALEALGDRVRLQLDYVATIEDGKVASMHGPNEVAGDIQQLCARQVAARSPDWLRFLACHNRSFMRIPGNGETCAAEASLKMDAFRSCVNGPLGESLLRQSLARAKERGATASPTIFLDGQEYMGLRTSRGFLRTLCGTLTGNPPKACTALPPETVVDLTILSDQRCGRPCETSGLEQDIRRYFYPGLKVQRLDYGTPPGKALFDELGLSRVPALLFHRGVEQAEAYPRMRRWLHARGRFLQLRVPAEFDPRAEVCDNGLDDTGDGKTDCEDPSCQAALACRPTMPRKLDLFVMSMCPYGLKALDAMREVLAAFKTDLDLTIHYIAKEDGDGFSALHGQPEVEENIRQLCARRHYPKQNLYLKYIWCRNRSIRSRDWAACATDGISAAVLRGCAEGEEGPKLLRQDLLHAKALNIQASPTWLANNRHLFNGVSAEAVRRGFCQHNPGLAACSRTLTDETDADAACGAAPEVPANGKAPPNPPQAEDPESYRIGVAACDRYVALFMRCIKDHLPEKARPLLEQSLKDTARQWRDAVQTEDGRKDLEQGCRSAIDAARTAMKTYGCEF